MQPLACFLHKPSECCLRCFPQAQEDIKMNDGDISSATELTLLHFYAPREISGSVAAENDY